jgi:aspartate racemase
MKTLGLIGGTSWVSTIDYYKSINELINKRLGGVNSAKLILYSVNFDEFQPPTDIQNWGPLKERFTNIAIKLQQAGAEGLVFCANTPHLVADEVQRELDIPIIHIAEATAHEVKKTNLKTVALLGTRITMEQDFYKNKVFAQGIKTIIPEANERQYIHDTILKEMCRNIFTKEMKDHYLHIINDLINKGAQGIIMGCTEIPMLIKKDECPVPSFDTTMLHAQAAVDFALSE